VDTLHRDRLFFYVLSCLGPLVLIVISLCHDGSCMTPVHEDRPGLANGSGGDSA
jgi:hypothetical protein